MPDRSKFLKLARDRFKQAQTAEKSQRDRELEDLRFYAGDQWPDDIKDARKGQEAGGGLPPVPARPMLTINKTREPVRQVLNQERQSDMGIEIVPADDFGDLTDTPDETEIQLREGLTRRIQRESEAADARTWAFARAVQAGRGFYGVLTRYMPGKTNDQEVYVHRYYNQACVTLDPAHEQPDGSDAEWGFVGTDMSWEAYKAEFGRRNGKKNRIADSTDDEFRAFGDEVKDWFTSEGETRTVRVVDYWYTVRKTRELVSYEDADGNQTVEWVDEMPDAPDGMTEVEDSRRTVIDKQIKWAKIDGCDDDVLDETDWPGPDMPIVKVLGEELQPYDTERRVEGMVRPMTGSGQGFNYMASRLVEVIGLSPIVPVMLVEGQDEGYEAEWDAINTRTLGRVHYKQTDLQDRPAPPPSVSPSQNPPIQAISVALEMFDQATQSTSGQHDPSLGKVDPSVKSGRAIQALQEQSQRSSNHFLDNLQRSIRYEGQIINNLLYPIYGRKGRIARIINGEGDAEHVLLHQPMIVQGGKPVPAPQGARDAKTYTLTKDAQFNVVIKVSKNYDTRRQQEVALIGEILAKDPTQMAIVGDLFFANQDGPGHQQMADRYKVMLAPPIQAMLAAKASGKDIPPEIQAQLASAQQQIQQLTQQLQEATKPGAVEQIRQQGLAQKTQIETQSKETIAAHDAATTLISAREANETKLAVAELGAKVDRLALFLEERARLGVQQDADMSRAHDVGMAALGHQQNLEAGEAGHAQALEQSDVQAQTAAEQADAQRQHEQQMAEQAQAAQQQPNGGDQ